ncbi:DUF29 domain-containing protein [Thermocrinis sp.]|uniref:DUF29 domain-containing protein n=1 Tax=Thermocrinis sp. TaxID=2024383 RepID=UPI002FDCE7F2
MIKQDLKQLYEKDFILWIEENLRLIKEGNYEEVDWENLLEEIEDMGRRHLESAVSYAAVVLEHLYKLEHFKVDEKTGKGWIKSILNARDELELLFENMPSVKGKVETKIDQAWKVAVKNLIKWFRDNEELAEKFFGKLPSKENFPLECPYSFEDLLSYEPWKHSL